MHLTNLLSAIDVAQIDGPTTGEIDGIAYDSRRVEANHLFVALTGEKSDGHDFISRAIDNGARAVVCEKPHHDARATIIRVADSRGALAKLANHFYQHPSRRLRVAGITGTNGKTTTAFLLKHLCEKAQRRCGLIGTVRYEIGDRVFPAARTTPEALDVQELLHEMRQAGCKSAVMEVSSHALTQRRVAEVEFDVAVFTNLTQDHLDFHGSMEKYFAAKSELFRLLAEQKNKKPRAIINFDDRYGAKLVERWRDAVSVTTYGVSPRADFRASNIKSDFGGTSYQLDVKGKSYLIRLPLIGRFNVYNSLAALAAGVALDLDLRESILALADAPAVPGRLEPVPARRQFRIFVDYAHTDDALINVMKTLRELNPARLIVVFGCGGNRDRAKRPLMGAAVDEFADHAIVTSDNPRKEDPAGIVAEILPGFRRGKFETVLDRREAIFRAVGMAEPRDIVLIAGKGHEKTQEFADKTIPFDDVAVAASALEQRPVEMQESK
jgi:UDP-N-acetylmuramoyl-L-alanyl-D-glutamate--2,6-diaminopimelate ligase